MDEREIMCQLSTLQHPFLVNLLGTFQVGEAMLMPP